jgi:hypothetical protein
MTGAFIENPGLSVWNKTEVVSQKQSPNCHRLIENAYHLIYHDGIGAGRQT